jgi:hypothetical protein
MRKLLITLLAGSLCALVTDARAQNAMEPRAQPYLFCNVYLSDFCFGIAPGDHLTMAHRGGFLLYNIDFSFGGHATLYYGFHPTLNADSEAATSFTSCVGFGGFTECKRREMKGGGIEILARRDAQSMSTHLTVSRGDAAAQAIESFIRNMRACQKKGLAITCEP